MPTVQSLTAGTLLEERSSTKRTYREFFNSESGAQSPSPSLSHLRFSITPAPSDIRNMSRTSPVPPRRYAGDGFDYRRPVMSTSRREQSARTTTSAPDVIDLTSDPDTLPAQPERRRPSVDRRPTRRRPSPRRRIEPTAENRQEDVSAALEQQPRATVIDLEALDSENATTALDADEPLAGRSDELLALFETLPSSPGFEITGERSLRPDPARSVAERRPTPYFTDGDRDPSEPPQLPPPPLFHNLPHGLASWIARTESRLVGGEAPARREGNSVQGAFRMNSYSLPLVPMGYNTGNGWQPQRQAQLPQVPAQDGFQRPRLNYEAQGFELIGAARSSPPPRPASPYKAPRTANGGFTRKVEEDDLVVCPHCAEELGVGSDDLKQQIWVVKQCGHVYCGECAMNRHVSRGKKMAPQVTGKPEPFKKCVVPDCDKPVTSKTALFQVYL